MERRFKGNLIYKGKEVVCYLHKYEFQDKDAIVVYEKNEDMEEVFTATICTRDTLDEGLVVIKDYSENTGVYDWLAKNNIIEKTNDVAITGYVTSPIGKIIYENFEECEFPY